MQDEEFSFKNLFYPITSLKAVHLLIIVGLIVFANSLFNGFIGDDFDQIVNNPLTHSPAHILQFFMGGTFFNGYSAQSGIYYKPLLSFFFSLLYPVSGGSAFIYHAAQLILHITNSILLFFFFKKFFKPAVSLLCSLIFLVHPINAESVLYVSALQDVLFLFFGLVFFLLLFKNFRKLSRLVPIYILLLCSLLSKEAGLLFLMSTFFYVLFFNKKNLKIHSILLSATFLLYLVFRVMAVGLYKTNHESFPFMNMGLLQRLSNTPAIFLSYFKLFVFPFNLAFTQNWTIKTVDMGSFYIPLLIILALHTLTAVAGLLLYKRKNKSLKLFVLFASMFWAGLILHSQILPLDMTIAERWMYFPIMGLLGLLGLVLNYIRASSKYFIPAIIFFSVVLLFYSYRSFQRTFDWRNQMTLYSHDVLVRPDSYNLQNGLSSEYLDIHDYKNAKKYALESIKLKPDYCYSWNNLGVVYLSEKNFDMAREALTTAIKNGGCYLSYQNMATFLYFHDAPKNTESFIKSTLKILPGNAKLWFMLSLTESKLGNKNEAIQDIIISNRLNPTSGAAFVYQQLINNKPIELKE